MTSKDDDVLHVAGCISCTVSGTAWALWTTFIVRQRSPVASVALWFGPIGTSRSCRDSVAESHIEGTKLPSSYIWMLESVGDPLRT